MKRIVVVFSIALAALLLIGTVCAVALQENPREQRQEKKEEAAEQRSENIQQRIETIIARFDNNKARHIAVYNSVKSKVQEIIQALEAEGYDVSKLKSDLTTFDSMIVKFGQDYATFVDKLRVAEQYTPGASGGQFQAAIQDARAQLRVVHQDALDIRHYYQTVIRPDVKAVRDQKPSS